MKWYVQVYDEDGFACKMLRTFEGTKKECEKYVEERFGLVDTLFGRTTVIYSSKKYTEDTIPMEIDLKKFHEQKYDRKS